MKLRLSVVVFLLSGFLSHVLAQEKQKETVRIAVRTGVFMSRFQIESPYNISFKGDDMYYVGLQAQIPISKSLYINPEVIYAASTNTYSNNNQGNAIIGNDDLSQILVPIQLKYQVGKLGLYIGGQGNILANAKASRRPIYMDRNVTDSSYKKISFSGIVGAEFVFNYRFGIDVRYSLGLSNMGASNGSTLATDNSNVKMNALQTGLFFRFGQKPKAFKPTR